MMQNFRKWLLGKIAKLGRGNPAKRETAMDKKPTDGNGEELSEQEKDRLMTLFSIYMNKLLEHKRTAWHAAGLFHGIFGAVVLGLIGAIVGAADKRIPYGGQETALLGLTAFQVILLILPVIGGFAAYFATVHIRRKTRLMSWSDANLYKIARAIKLNKLVASELRFFNDDPNLLTPYWFQLPGEFGISAENLEDWVMQYATRHQQSGRLIPIFYIEILASIIISMYLALYFWYPSQVYNIVIYFLAVLLTACFAVHYGNLKKG